MGKYFIHDGQDKIGPFDFEQLKTLEIKNETPIWYEGLQMWTRAGDLEEFKTILNSSSFPPKFENYSQQNRNPSVASRLDHISSKINFNKLIVPVGALGALILFLFFSGTIYPEDSELNKSSKQNQADVDLPVATAKTNAKTNTTKRYISSNAKSEKKNLITEIGEKNRNCRNNIKQYVKVNTNQYNTYTLGGISDLNITVTNNTECLLDRVNVSVDYIKDNGRVYKSEIVTIYNIPAYQAKSVSAPESERGTSVSAKIKTVSSKKLHLYYDDSIVLKAEVKDPFYVK